MIYPATYNIVILQDSTWKASLRLTGTAKDVAIDIPNSLFASACHGLSADNPIIFTAKSLKDDTVSAPPCGVETNKPYYVIATGLTANHFAVSETIGGESITLHGTQTGYFAFARPINLAGATIDADIKSIAGGFPIKTFTCTILAPTLGELEMLLSDADTASLDPLVYAYDLSVTTAAGEKYYWLTGKVEVRQTYSRD
jgi:hypothetical protein